MSERNRAFCIRFRSGTLSHVNYEINLCGRIFQKRIVKWNFFVPKSAPIKRLYLNWGLIKQS